MKILTNNKLIILGLTTLLMASCSSMMKMAEPEAYIRYDKEEFDYSEQVTGEATSVKILMVDWSRLFNTEKGAVSGSSPSIFGLLPSSKIEGHALYDLFSKNSGYDFIVYPQYEVLKTAPGMGLFYSKTTAITRARLAVTNDVIIEEAATTSVSGKQSKEMESSLLALQSAYDALVEEVSDIKTESATKEAMLQKQVKNAEAKAASSTQTTAVTTASANAPVATQSAAQEATPTAIHPLSSNKMSSPSEVKTVAGTYTLIIGSYSTSANAERAVMNFNKKYPSLKGRVGVVIAAEKFRIGFINFRTRNDAVVYKTNLTTKYPEFKSAWPYKP